MRNCHEHNISLIVLKIGLIFFMVKILIFPVYFWVNWPVFEIILLLNLLKFGPEVPNQTSKQAVI